MLTLHQISKRYDDHILFQGLSRSFEPGCFALSEEDSTGKTTLLSLIAGVVPPDEGDIIIDGYSLAQAPEQALSRVVYIPEHCPASPTQTGRQWLEAMAKKHHASVNQSVMAFASQLGLDVHLDKPFEQMSTGTRRKMLWAAADIGQPAVMIADGPSNGLDTPGRQALAAQLKIWANTRVILLASYDHALLDACGAYRLQAATLAPIKQQEQAG
ncbi:ABC transporter ATP-binding protein [Castellaniella sp.]|uniref:ABC transporter ATP-binding protein n=1 Tax=Castellaniella sp. TaxID=1955812 RepID=UPI003A95A0FF